MLKHISYLKHLVSPILFTFLYLFFFFLSLILDLSLSNFRFFFFNSSYLLLSIDCAITSMPLILLYLKSNPPRVLLPSPIKVLFHFTILHPPFIYLRLPLSYVITGHANLFVTLTVDL
jgi:hypothetical protein